MKARKKPVFTGLAGQGSWSNNAACGNVRQDKPVKYSEAVIKLAKKFVRAAVKHKAGISPARQMYLMTKISKRLSPKLIATLMRRVG